MIRDGVEYEQSQGDCNNCCFPRLGISCATTACSGGYCWYQVVEINVLINELESWQLVEGVEYTIKKNAEGEMILCR